MKIHALAQRTGLTPPTIRFYESKGLLDERQVVRWENNYRDYSEEAVEHLLMIKKLQAVGFTLTELKEVIQADKVNELPLSKKIELFRQKIQEIERKKDELEQAQIHLERMLANKMKLIDAEKNRNV